MNLLQWSIQSFNVAAVLYVLAFLLYAGHLVSDKKLFASGSSWLARAGFLAHTAGLGFRWALAGIGHPPWSNLYESLVFFSWGVMGVHVYLEWRSGARILGVFATVVTFVALGIASLHPHKEIEPLVPALQSWWILIHVFMACVAYAFFMGSSFASVFYLLKERLRLETMVGVAALVCLLFLSISVGKDFLLTSELQFFKVVPMPGPDGVVKNVIMNFKDEAGNPMQQFVTLTGAGWLVWPSLALYLISAALLLWTMPRSKRRDEPVRLAASPVGADVLREPDSALAAWGRRLFVGATLVHAGLLAYMIVGAQTIEGMKLMSNPYRLAGVIMTFGIAVFFSLLFRFKELILRRLPSEEVLDRWGYEGVLLGIPFMTLNLITGAVWAYYAWGRYWGWDPKETWALITWFTYLIYLHMRVLGGWKGRKTALISIAGFFIVIFTYLGVNLVVSGLHSYATS